MEKTLSIREAIWHAVAEQMSIDDKVIVWGEGVTSKISYDYPDLLSSFPDRVQNMPISEAAIVSAGLGASLVGMKPIIDLSFDDLSPRVMDEILNQVAKVRYVTGANSKPSMIIKMDLPPVRCAQTGQRLESFFMRIPGIALAIPSSASDAYGLMKASLCSDDVIMMVEDRWITAKEVVTTGKEVSFGKASIRRKGSDVTVITYGYMVWQAVEAANILAKRGVDVEVLDLRTLSPLDLNSILSSVRKTKRVITLEGGWRSCGVGAEVCSLISEHLHDRLASAPIRLGARMAHIPTSSALRMKAFPSQEDLVKSIENLMIPVKA